MLFFKWTLSPWTAKSALEYGAKSRESDAPWTYINTNLSAVIQKKSNDWAQIMKTSTHRPEEAFISKTKDARVSILSDGSEKSDLACKKKCKNGSLYIS